MLLVAAAVALGVGGGLQTATFKGSPELVLNPERGFRHEIDSGCDSGPVADARWTQVLAEMAQYNLTVVQTYCYLVPESETQVPAQLSTATVGKLADAFARLRTAGAKALLRFAYDRDMPGTHAYNAQTILGHIKQLQPAMAPNYDGLYVLQAGFIGSWGEWHSALANIKGNATAVSEIIEAELFTLLPPDRKLNVRVPVYKLSGTLRRRMSGEPRPPQLVCDPSMVDRTECSGAFGGINASQCRALGCCYSTCEGCPECYAGYSFPRPVVADESRAPDRMAFGVATDSKANTAVSRVGFDNDGFLSTSNDGGTYGNQYTEAVWAENAGADSAPFPSMQGSENGSLATPTFKSGHGMMADRSFLYAVKEAPFVPIDGEMFWHAGSDIYDDSWPRHVSAETASWRLREMHYSTLSLAHGFSGLDGTPSTRLGKNETIDLWMQSPLNVGQIVRDRLPVSMDYAVGRNHTGFEYVRDHLGYRLELQSATFPQRVALESASDVTVTIPSFNASVVNFGFAAPINPRPVYLALLTPDGSGVLWTGSGWPDRDVNETTTSLADVRDWQPFTPGDPTYSSLAHPFGSQNITLYSTATRTASSRRTPQLPPCLGDVAGCMLPLALFLPDLRLQKCVKCNQSEAYSIVFANDERTMGVSSIEGIGRFNVVGKVNVGVTNAVLAAAGGAV